MTTHATERLLKPHEVWERLAISKATFYRLVESGQLPAVRIGGQLRIDERELEAWIYEGKA